MSEKSSRGHFFEDFLPGTTLHHATPRTLTEADNTLYLALTGDRSPLFCSDEFARSLGYPRAPLHDLLVFHTVFGKSVPDVSLNAVANLGYADVRFLRPVYPGDTLRAESRVLGRRETSAGDAGIVWVHTTGFNQHAEAVLAFYRWVMVRKRDPATATGTGTAEPPVLPAEVGAATLRAPAALDLSGFNPAATGGRWFFDDYRLGERIDHIDGMTIEEAEHASATRLYQNTARLHFNLHLMQADPRFGRRLMYGGHVISIAKALSYNGLENALCTLAWNGGTHANPTFAGDTLYAWSEVLDAVPLPDCPGGGALRLRLVAVKNTDPAREAIPLRVTDERTGRTSYHPNVVLDLDHWVLMPRRHS